jgi:DNA repair photolyase
VLVAPVLPGLSDRREQLDEVVGACVDAGATSISSVLLHLRPGVREHYLGWLQGYRPDLMEQHLRLYRRAYAPREERDRVSGLVQELVREHRGMREPM